MLSREYVYLSLNIVRGLYENSRENKIEEKIYLFLINASLMLC